MAQNDFLAQLLAAQRPAPLMTPEQEAMLAAQEPQSANQMIQGAPEAAPTASSLPLQSITLKTKGAANPLSYGKEFDDNYHASILDRRKAIAELQARLQETELKKPEGLQAMNLAPAMGFADSLLGTSVASSYKDPQALEKHQALVDKLQAAIAKDSNSLSDDQLAYLKQKANEQSMAIKEAKDRAALARAGETDENRLRQQYLAHPAVKGMNDVDSAYRAIQSNPGNDGPSQQAMVFQFSKILDPNSVVREGEYAQSAANAGAINRAMNYFEQLKSGKMLTPEQISAMKEVTSNLTNSYRQKLNGVNQSFIDLANRKGINPKNVVIDAYTNEADISKNRSGASNKPITKPAPKKNPEDMTDDELRAYLGG